MTFRWRLPLSYGALALLTALSLGVVLLTTLRRYYTQRELDYLTSNAQAVSSQLAFLVEDELPPAALQSQLKGFSFLSETRVRLLDTQGRVLADSGSPGEQREVATIAVAVEVDGLSQAVTQTVEGGREEKSYTSVIVLDGERSEVQLRESVVVSGTGLGSATGLLEKDTSFVRHPGLTSRIPGFGALYGSGPYANTGEDNPRSTQVVSQPVYGGTGKLLGRVELSEGPAYGRQILNSVAWGWATASGVAVLLAASIGWGMSRQISAPLLALTGVTARMAGGDLSVRADMARQDELGLLARSFNDMAERVEETVVALRRFVADAAHELHTPLTALRTNMELIAGEECDAARQTLVGHAQAQVERLEALTSGLLELSRLEAAPVPEDRGTVDLSTVIKETCELYASRAEQAGLAFYIDLPDEAAEIQGHGSQLRRALGNLLDNALKFTPEGGSVNVGLRQNGAWAELWIEDTGIGIPPEDLPQLFGRFHRGRNAAAYPGNGLGLAIVQAIVEGHRGQVIAENTACGARFLLRLPTARL